MMVGTFTTLGLMLRALKASELRAATWTLALTAILSFAVYRERWIWY